MLTFAHFSFAQSIDVKDSDDHTLIQIYDEGDDGGSILFPDASTLDIINNKLYNIDGDLHWNGEEIGPCNCDITRTEFDELISNLTPRKSLMMPAILSKLTAQADKKKRYIYGSLF